MDRWIFPVGTKLWKEFSFKTDENDRLHRVETRYSEKLANNSWVLRTYIWNADETEATLAPVSGIPSYYAIRGGVKHDIPSKTQCTNCHNRGGDQVLGFDAIQLSTARDIPSNGQINLKILIDQGLLTKNPLEQPRIISFTPSGSKALGYLHSNCGGCHNSAGSAKSTQLFLRHQIEGIQKEQVPLIFSYFPLLERSRNIFHKHLQH